MHQESLPLGYFTCKYSRKCAKKCCKHAQRHNISTFAIQGCCGDKTLELIVCKHSQHISLFKEIYFILTFLLSF
ncbi:hypothetical protein XENTR_v10008791 [Xenopus tropicalis]|nr:hypothetical protein XENTR_v10008791 [Xenopus tropicalis]